MKGKCIHSGIQILRGICAIQVFLSHALNIYYIDWIAHFNDTPFRFFYDGSCAVVVFFVLSGYLYYKEEPLSWHKYLHGIKKKCFRIFPAYWLSLILGFAFCNLYIKGGVTGGNLTKWSEMFWRQEVPIIELIKNVFVLIPHNWDTINPASWYIEVEVQMFILMPLIISCYNKLVQGKKSFYYFVIWVALIIGGLLWSPNMLAYLIGAAFHKLKLVNRYNLLLLIISLMLLNIKNELPIVKDLPGSAVLLIQAVAAAIIINMIMAIDSNCFKRCKLLIFLGDVSYEIYIMHFIFLLILKPFFSNVLLFVIITFAISLLCASILHLYSKRIMKGEGLASRS